MKIALNIFATDSRIENAKPTLQLLGHVIILRTSHLQNMPKYKLVHNKTIFKLNFRYYSGEKKAPILTIFIGGNHEASNYLQELPYGGWVAPNIYYLGRAGVIQFGDLRIGGM